MSNIDFNYLQTISNLILHDIDQLVRWHVHFNVENPRISFVLHGRKNLFACKMECKNAHYFCRYR